jgi:hypothetical protein
MSDFPRFAHNFIQIVNNDGKRVKFDLNEAQVELNNLIDTHKFVCVAKARQSGISTYCLAKALWRTVTRPNENIMIASYKIESCTSLFNKLKEMNDWLPRKKFPSLFPSIVHDNRNELSFANGSKISCVTAGNKPIGRGSTFSWIHLTEAAFYRNFQEQLLSCEQSLEKGENSRLTIETTSNGMNGWYKLFSSAYRGQSKYVAYFVPFCHKLYQKQFHYDYNLAEKWHIHYFHDRLHAKDLEPEEKVIYDKCHNLKTIEWRRWKLLDMSLDDFHQEYPSTPLESFVNTGRTIFNQVKVLEGMQYAKKPLSKKEVLNSDIPDELKRYVGKELLIYELPQRLHKYAAGVDISQGVGSDSSAMTIFNFDGMEVCNFNHNKVPPYLYSKIVVLLGHWYNYAMLAIETNGIGGSVVTSVKKKYNYVNLYKQKGAFYKGQRTYHVGFDQSIGNAKTELIDQLREQFETGMIMINTKNTFEEMQIFVEKDSGTLGNSGDGHDDDVISAALGVECLKYASSHWFVKN